MGRRHAEIRSLYVNQLAHAWVEDSTQATRVRVEEKIDSFTEGDNEHVAEALSELLKIANKKGDVVPPSNSSSDVSLFIFSPVPCNAYSA